MSRQLYKLFFIAIWLMTVHAPARAQERETAQAQAQETESIRSYPADPPTRQVPDSVSERLKKQKEFLYANDPAFWKKDQRSDALGKAGASFLTSPIFKVVMYGLLTLLIAFVLYQIIVVNNLFIVRKSRRRKKEAGEEETALTTDQLEAGISRAVTQGQFRTAIRYYYLLTLRRLHDRNMIRLDARSTNYDYLSQMQGKKSAPDFAHLTRIYEYVWYGQHQPDASQFEKIQSGFKQFIAAA